MGYHNICLYMSTHLNCIDKSMQFKWVPTTLCLYKDGDKKYTGCNLKTTEWLDCVLKGVCAEIRSNTVIEGVPIFRGNLAVYFTFHQQCNSEFENQSPEGTDVVRYQ